VIRYALSEKELRARIETEKQGWRARANAQTENNAATGNPVFPSLWSEIKQVYIDLQHSKCAFCEKPLEGRIEQDVEHFRPKGKVTAWSPSQALRDEGLVLRQPADGSDELGYRHLAYHPLNYAMSCKTCNSVFKRNLFPIINGRRIGAKKPPSVSIEKPLLVYPIGNSDDDPETLLEFEGWTTRAKHATGFGRLRALPMIELFRLNDWQGRKELLAGRARQIQLLYLNLAAIDECAIASVVKAAKSNTKRMLLDSEPHANCLRSFARLYQKKPGLARAYFLELSEYLETISL
jgi:hypothetical protein